MTSDTVYQVVELDVDDDSTEGYEPRGAVKELWVCRDHEVIIHGPSETGKTMGALQKASALCMKYDGAQIALIRKRRVDMQGTVLQTLEKKVWSDDILGSRGDDKPIIKFGGEHVEHYEFWNGSRIWVGGIDKPGKVLSGERDFFIVNQVEELDEDDWQIILTRATGRSGNTPYTQVIGDANPAPCSHWMYSRRDNGLLTMLYSIHEDNPSLFDDYGNKTIQGIKTMSILNKLRGVYKIRLKDGKCGSPEGQVMDYNPAHHLIKPPKDWPINPVTGKQEPPPDWERIRSIDFGADKPFCCAWWAFDYDRRMYCYRYIYMTMRTVRAHSKQINELSKGEYILTTVCDHDLEDRMTLEENGIPNEAAYKPILYGINKCNERFAVSEIDDLPRIFIVEDSLVEIDERLQRNKQPYRGEQEFDLYVWSNKAKEAPVDAHNHFIDQLRYAVVWEDGNTFRWVG